MEIKRINSFIYSVGIIFFAAAITRFMILAQNTHMSRLLLQAQDPLLDLKIRYEVWMAAIGELSIAVVCFLSCKPRIRIVAIAWVVTIFLVFQIGLILAGFKTQNSCFGRLTDPLHLTRGGIGFIVKLVPYYLVIVTYGILGYLLSKQIRQHMLENALRQEAMAGVLKMSCHACGGHIKFSAENDGQRIPCPHCQADIILRRPEHIKFSCFFCKGHIEFPAHAIGEIISCPHCKMDIKLKLTS